MAFRKTQWPIQHIMVLGLVVLTTLMIGGAWAIAHRLQSNQQRNIEQVHSASARLEEMVGQVKDLIEQQIPLRELVARQQLAAQQANEQLLLYVLEDEESSAASLQEAVGRLSAQQQALAERWPAAYPQAPLEALTGTVSIISDISEEILETQSRAQLDEMAEDSRATSLELIQETKNMTDALEAATGQSNALVVGGSDAVLNANRDTLRNAEELNTLLRRQVLWIMGLVIVVAVVSQGVVFVVLRKRLRAAVDVINQLVSGRLDIKRVAATRDEIGQVMTAVQHMGHTLSVKAKLAERIATRDLSSEIELASEDDGLGHALNRMVANLSTDIREVSGAAEQLAKATQDLSVSSGELSQGAAEQANTLQRIAAASELLLEKTRRSSENAQRANELVKSAHARASDGSRKMRHTVESMAAIQAASTDISRIATLIEEIAYQTNILSLNASIEASQAGESGKGFGVVAKEVRHLAKRCAEAAQDTSRLINKTTTTVATGLENANESATAFEAIVGDVQRVVGFVDEIAQAGAEQESDIGDINDGLSGAAGITEQNTVVANRNASTSEQLSKQMQRLSEIVLQFNVGREHGATT